VLVAASKIHFKEQALGAGSKQSNQASKAGMPTRQSGPACSVLELFAFLLFQVGFVLTYTNLLSAIYFLKSMLK